jgi:ABC-type iron transport system FetAB permease component
MDPVLIIQLLVILCFYIVPYIFLHDSKGLELFLFYVIATSITGIISINRLNKIKGEKK